MTTDTPPPPANAEQMASPSFSLATLDQTFLLSDSMRGVRFLLEYEKAEQLLKAQRIMSTIVVFGSARIRADGPNKQAHWYSQARAFGRLASERGGALCEEGGERHHVIATGGGPGAMEAACRGAREAGAPAIGFNITLPHEQEPNAYTTPELTFNFHYFAMRKMHLAMRAKALVVFPGGYGTADELFELLTLRQTRKMAALPIVLFDEGYWREVMNFDALVRHGMIDAADLTLFRYADTAEAAWDALIEQGLMVGQEESDLDIARDM
ncbi:MAG: TIGR00730 family Rossman fold protein [Hyphomonadaceae bacterium]|nr:TIGR00730 family Rossman fold protein [Hyphomonadaceae bacterium]MBX3509927.1 TIGR00730 family Rossman fold protein [Hyphomonadaceae bacterium]